MEYRDIHFKVIKDKERVNLLSVTLDIQGVGDLSNLQLYKGKVNLEEVKSHEEFFSDSNFIYIYGKNNRVRINYSLNIGGLGKHGRLGELRSDLISFMGEQFLMLPVELLALGDEKASECNITIDFTDFKELINLEVNMEETINNREAFLERVRDESKVSDSLRETCNEFNSLEKERTNDLKCKTSFYSVIPFKEDDFKISLSNPSWSDLYELMKSAYNFGYFNLRKSKDKGGLKLYIENKILNEMSTSFMENEDGTENNLENFHDKSIKKVDLDNSFNEDEVFENINRLYSYYAGLFNYGEEEKELNIILLGESKKDNKNILGGSGKNIICASFHMNNKRDWQLLSHRMLHAFMDSKLPSRAYHLPPNLWLTEGIATYYELLALESLNEDSKENLGIDFNKEISRLYTRYLYMTLKDPSRFKIIPMEERKIKSHGKLEFLHYAKAPLIIYLIESLTKESLGENSVINYLVLNKDKDFSMEHMFKSLLKENCNDFARNYLFGNSIFPLWNLREYVCEEDVLKDLNEYEYILWTWFYKEEQDYEREDLEKYPLEDIKKSEKILNTNIYNSELSKNLEDYSNTLSLLLKSLLFNKIGVH